MVHCLTLASQSLMICPYLIHKLIANNIYYIDEDQLYRTANEQTNRQKIMEITWQTKFIIFLPLPFDYYNRKKKNVDRNLCIIYYHTCDSMF